MEKPIVFKNNLDQQLVGILHWPKTKKKVPLVIVCHGFWASKTRPRFVELGRELEKNNMATLRFDFTGCGDSQGTFIKSDLYQQISDLESAYKFAQHLKFVDKNKIGIYAESFATVVTTLFNNKKAVIKTMILLAPALNQKVLLKNFYSKKELKNCQKNGFFVHEKYLIGQPWIKAVINKDFSLEAKKIKTPTLVIFGDKDDVVPPNESKRIFNLLTSKKKMVVIKNGDHTFQPYFIRKKLINHLVLWFNKYLK